MASNVYKRIWCLQAFILSAAIGAITLLILSSAAFKSKPENAHALPTAATVSGIYKCCGTGDRSTASWVGSTRVKCLAIGYFDYQTAKHNDCGMEDILNGAFVTARQVAIPTSSGGSLRVSELLLGDKQMYSRTKEQLYERWVHNSIIGAVSGAFDTFVAAYVLAFIFFHKRHSK
jgi:hypothetical protein